MSESVSMVNRVANSGLITIDLEDFYPAEELIELDIKQFLFKELIIKELDFRKALQEYNWSQYDGKILCVFCSTDAIIPTWAYMLIARYTHGHVVNLFWGEASSALIQYFDFVIKSKDWSQYQGSKVVIKGCSHKPVPASAYQSLTSILMPICNSIMYGEPCSTVPIYKQKINSGASAT